MEKLFLWGTGKIALEVMQYCRTIGCYNVLGYIDNNIEKIGTTFCGKDVYSPDILESTYFDKIVILSNFYSEIKDQIKKSFPEYLDRVENKYYFYKRSILQRYSNTKDEDIIEIIKYLNHNDLSIFNNEFESKYNNNTDIEVFWDDFARLYYLIHKGKRMYFSSRFKNENQVIKYYRNILVEQDENSPHRYIDDEFGVELDDVVVDAGAAEGNFSLEVIDRCKHLYIIEADQRWIEALKFTFNDYMDKVTIIEGYLSDYCEGNLITLDRLINESVNFIKMDIEGSEYDALLGAKRLINNSNKLKLAICCYHSDFDQVLIETFMNENHIKHSTTKGYMWFPYLIKQNYVSTKFQRGVIRGLLNRTL